VAGSFLGSVQLSLKPTSFGKNGKSKLVPRPLLLFNHPVQPLSNECEHERSRLILTHRAWRRVVALMAVPGLLTNSIGAIRRPREQVRFFSADPSALVHLSAHRCSNDFECVIEVAPSNPTLSENS